MKSRKIILHLTPQAAFGGCEVNCLRIIEGLSDFDHRVVVFDDCGPMSSEWEAAGARVDHLSAWQFGRRKFYSKFNTWIKNSAVPYGVYYWSTSRLPLIVEAIKNWNVPLVVHLGNPIRWSLRERAERWAHEHIYRHRRNVVLIACSNYVAASHACAYYFRGFDTKVIYNPVAQLYDQVRIYRRLPLGSGPRVGMVARLDSIKDHATVLRALVKVRSVRPDLVIEFAGDGSLRNALELQAKQLGVADNVRFLGFTRVAPLLSGWDIYVHSTTAAEGMGTAVAEAMMAGLPCIVSDLAVMREVCGIDGARYVPEGDSTEMALALIRLVADQASREVLGFGAQARARRLFTLSDVSKRYLNAISQAVDAPKSATLLMK